MGAPPPPAFKALRVHYGFIPALFQTQSDAPRLVEAEATLLAAVMAKGTMSRLEKERLLLAVAAARANQYVATLHFKLLTLLGVDERELERLIADPTFPEPVGEAALTMAWGVFLCALAEELAVKPDFAPVELLPVTRDIPPPRALGDARVAAVEVFTKEVSSFCPQGRLEEAAAAAFGRFLQFLHLPGMESRRNEQTAIADPDAELVARVKGGDVDGFEELMSRNTRCVYRTLVGILGDREEARDAMQDTFLKAFQHLGRFEGRSRFSTWLLSIASNTALQRLRERHSIQSLDENPASDDEPFRPVQLKAWTDDPEQLCSKAQNRVLVETCVMRLPAIYRVVVLLRDIEQLSVEETAVALGLGIPATKSRLLRARLMLREALAPHFAKAAKGGTA